MLKAKSFPKTFSIKVVTCAVFLLNRCSTKAVFGRPLEKSWSGHKPQVSFLRIFRCVAYSHIPNEHRKKFDDKSEKCIFIGYSDVTKVHKLYNLKTGKLIVSRDVQFLENENWTWTQIQSEEKWVVIEEDFENQKDSTTYISTSNTSSPIRSSPMQTVTWQKSKSQGHSKRSYIMPTHIKDYEVMKYTKITNEGLVNFCLFAYCDPISYKETVSDEKWIQVMNEKIQSIEKNNT